MKLSQTNGNLFSYYNSVGETLEHLKKCGFSCVDISFFACFRKGSVYFSDNYMDVVNEYLRALDKTGITPVQAHEPAGNRIGDDGGEYYMKKGPRSIEMAAKIGCPSITVHAGCTPEKMSRDEFLYKNIEAFRKIIPCAEKNNIEILIENIGTPEENYHVHNEDEVLDIVNGLNHPLFKVCWDVGHANLNGVSQYEAIKKLGSKLGGVHVHDNLGFAEMKDMANIACDMHTIPGFGCIDFESVIKALTEIGYKGAFNFEVDSPKSRLSYSPDMTPTKFDRVSKDIRLESDTLLYNIGKRMLAEMNCFEE